jgi:hypothetical protein
MLPQQFQVATRFALGDRPNRSKESPICLCPTPTESGTVCSIVESFLLSSQENGSKSDNGSEMEESAG